MLTRAHSDFLTDEQRMIRDTARDFARAELAPHAGAWEEESWIPDAVVPRMGELGLFGILLPQSLIRTASDYVAYPLKVEEIAPACPTSATHMNIQDVLVCGPKPA